MARKASRKTLKNKCDRLFSLYIRARDGACVLCASEQNLQCAHGFSRRYHGTRWDERNAWALCAGCHWKMTHDPIRWDSFMRDTLGAVVYSELRGRAVAIARHQSYEDIIADLEEKLSGEAA